MTLLTEGHSVIDVGDTSSGLHLRLDGQPGPAPLAPLDPTLAVGSLAERNGYTGRVVVVGSEVKLDEMVLLVNRALNVGVSVLEQMNPGNPGESRTGVLLDAVAGETWLTELSRFDRPAVDSKIQREIDAPLVDSRFLAILDVWVASEQVEYVGKSQVVLLADHFPHPSREPEPD